MSRMFWHQQVLKFQSPFYLYSRGQENSCDFLSLSRADKKENRIPCKVISVLIVSGNLSPSGMEHSAVDCEIYVSAFQSPPSTLFTSDTTWIAFSSSVIHLSTAVGLGRILMPFALGKSKAYWRITIQDPHIKQIKLHVSQQWWILLHGTKVYSF